MKMMYKFLKKEGAVSFINLYAINAYKITPTAAEDHYDLTIYCGEEQPLHIGINADERVDFEMAVAKTLGFYS